MVAGLGKFGRLLGRTAADATAEAEHTGAEELARVTQRAVVADTAPMEARVLPVVDRARIAGGETAVAQGYGHGVMELGQVAAPPVRSPYEGVRLVGSKVDESWVEALKATGDNLRLDWPEVNELVERARAGLGTPEELTAEMNERAAYRLFREGRGSAPNPGRLPNEVLAQVVQAGSRDEKRLGVDEILEVQERVAKGFTSPERAIRELQLRLAAKAPRPAPLTRPPDERLRTSDGLLREFVRSAGALGLGHDDWVAFQDAILGSAGDAASLTQLKDQAWDFLLYGSHARSLKGVRAEEVVEAAALDSGFSPAEALAKAEVIRKNPEQLPSTLDALWSRRVGIAQRADLKQPLAKQLAEEAESPSSATLARAADRASRKQSEAELAATLKQIGDQEQLTRALRRYAIPLQEHAGWQQRLGPHVQVEDVIHAMAQRSQGTPFDFKHFGEAHAARTVAPEEYASSYTRVGLTPPAQLGAQDAKNFKESLATYLHTLRQLPAEHRGQTVAAYQELIARMDAQAAGYAAQGNLAGAEASALQSAAARRALHIAATEL